MKLKALIQKEFQRFFRDPKLIVTLVLPGILIYFIYSLMGGLIWDEEKDYSYDVLVYGSSPAVEALFEGSLGDSLTLTRTEDKENAKAQVKAGSVTALVVFSDDFDNAVSNYDPMSGEKAPMVEIFYRSADDASAAFYTAATSLLSVYEGTISNAFDVNLGDEQYDFSSTSEVVMTILGGLLPFLVVTLIFSSCTSITLESVAGEKERGRSRPSSSRPSGARTSPSARCCRFRASRRSARFRAFWASPSVCQNSWGSSSAECSWSTLSAITSCCLRSSSPSCRSSFRR